MYQSRRIALLIQEGGQCMDAIGPLEVFATANRQLVDDGACHRPAYELLLVSDRPGPVRQSSGAQLVAEGGWRELAVDELHTLLVAGGTEACIDDLDPDLVAWLAGAGERVSRLGSICNGALILSRAGLLDGRRATTHWMDAQELARNTAVTVDSDAIYVRDGGTWTSAGMTAGMDLALAMVAEDHGMPLALRVAKRMVLFMKRSGGQKQYSDALFAQLATDRFSELIDWIRANLRRSLTVADLAERVHMSPRHFARRFRAELGMTPQQFIEALRVEAAKALLESSREDLSRIAARCGFASAEAMRRRFVRSMGVSPRHYRCRFDGGNR